MYRPVIRCFLSFYLRLAFSVAKAIKNRAAEGGYEAARQGRRAVLIFIQ
jgi:hypothetical protein